MALIKRRMRRKSWDFYWRIKRKRWNV